MIKVHIGYDCDAECPMENDGWKLKSFNRNSIHHVDPNGYFPLGIGLRRKLDTGLAFLLQYYEHGEGRYDIQGHGPQCEWDTTKLAGILIWEWKPKELGAKTKEDREADATRFLETYNAWANGHIYYCNIESEDGTIEDATGGLYEDGLKEFIKEVVGDAEYEVNEDMKWLL